MIVQKPDRNKTVIPMDMTRYVSDVTGHAIQFIPAMLLYFRCVPEERYRFAKRKTVGWFCLAFCMEILLTSAVKLMITERNPRSNPDLITYACLVAEFILLMAATGRVMQVHKGPNRVIVLLSFYWAVMLYALTRLLLAWHTTEVTYDATTIVVLLIVTLVLFPAAVFLMAPFAREYLLVRDRVRPQVKATVTIMTVISLVQVYAISLHPDRQELPFLALMSVSITVIYMLLIRYVVVEEQRTGMELHLLASQIRPHFIRNALNAICNLVDEDPQATIQAIYDFSGYLRMNYEALEKSAPVPFTEELEHAKFYLSIEKLRFRDELQMEIDTPVTDFFLPALTVQPMVENAVRHGLRAKEGGGTLRLSTRETDRAYEVVIQDDGVGFQNRQAEEDGVRPPGGGHYGLVNVEARLKRMVSGSISIDSVSGEGTSVIIRIPKKEEHSTGEGNAG
ncbi:MAG: histidine kinase [Lachnospiraceae bacterium]|nr:histidine kinase [Lachnospiraceae bacterium]